ncbi:hypothetical protein HPB51_017453 [Rhipicephalus microplus]|uniref:Uncharacterized protein n=1 Tax=Rhipicephalus microplus TaxID=6941 RepID=A0A9J6F4M0_RHIMP|nr:hypothetical protein HPB51_017453 [Rhipicephalus microplus]
MMGQTNIALVTFEGLKVPHCVRFFGVELRFYPHRPRQVVCKICFKLGHWDDHCPTPDAVICLTCGTDNPIQSHRALPTANTVTDLTLRRIQTALGHCNKTSLNPYANPTVDPTQNVVLGTSNKTGAEDVLSTFESRATIRSKFCDINKMFENLQLGLALFDLECEDWKFKCPEPTAGMRGTYRFGNVSKDARTLANDGVAVACL